MKSIAIIAGGEIQKQFVGEICKAGVIIGADRGALWLLKNGVAPDLAIGDFDSVTELERRKIHKLSKKFIRFSSDKDKTDLEIAVDEAVKLRPNDVHIYGALGNRFDHSIGAIQMLLRLASYNINGEIVDNFNKIHIVRHTESVNKDKGFPYISFLPFGLDAVITLKGFVYDVVKKTLHAESSLGISNEIKENAASVTVHKGAVLVVRSRDHEV